MAEFRVEFYSKDALNDIRLSSAFCAKMEERLSRAAFDDDGYQEVENHVEVIENKGFKKYIAAAAVIAVIGAVGGGGFLHVKDNFSIGKNYDVEDEDDIEGSGITEAHDGNTVFDFPFGESDLSGVEFIYAEGFCGNIMSQLSATADDETASQLVNAFSNIDWHTN